MVFLNFPTLAIDRLGQEEPLGKGIVERAKENPGIFLLEIVAVLFMLIGMLTAGEWAFRTGYALGTSF